LEAVVEKYVVVNVSVETYVFVNFSVSVEAGGPRKAVPRRRPATMIATRTAPNSFSIDLLSRLPVAGA